MNEHDISVIIQGDAIVGQIRCEYVLLLRWTYCSRLAMKVAPRRVEQRKVGTGKVSESYPDADRTRSR